MLSITKQPSKTELITSIKRNNKLKKDQPTPYIVFKRFYQVSFSWEESYNESKILQSPNQVGSLFDDDF